MRKLLFALAVVVMGGFAFASGTPASAMSAGALTTMSDVVNSSSTAEKVAWVRTCSWRYGRRHCRSYWRPSWRYGYRRSWRHHDRRRCHWRYGRRICRY